MTTKLTLTIDKKVIERAKIYAKGTQRSLSEMVQNYLESLTNQDMDEKKLSPKMKKLLSMLPKDTPSYTDEEIEEIKREYLEKKYS